MNKREAAAGFLLLIAIIVLPMNSCKVSYSFTGASVSPDVKTISIPYFPNTAPLVVPTLSKNFTDALRDYFTSQTNLLLVDRNGDLAIDGTITGYEVQPTAIQGNETAAMNRMTITVSVKFTNKKNPKQDFEPLSFSRYLDYPSSQSLSSVQDGLIKDITDQLVQDIFNRTIANW